MTTTSSKTGQSGKWLPEFLAELDRTLPAFLATGWTYRFDPRSCMVHLFDASGKGRAAVALPDGHAKKRPEEIARVICRTSTRLARDSGMER